MSVNSTFNFFLEYDCFNHTASSNMFTAISAMRAFFLLPVSTLVLYLGYQQWRQQHSFQTASHSDIFAYNMAATELIWVAGCFCTFDGTYNNHSAMFTVGSIASHTGLYAEMGFHILSCLECYLAVVHPISYLHFKNVHGVRIRNISVGCVWLFCFGLIGVHRTLTSNRLVPLFFVLALVIMITFFCSLSVLCVLIHPGPGKEGGENQRVDRLKLRAFFTIIAITCTVWLWFVGLLVTKALSESPLLSNSIKCMVEKSVVFFNLPSSLVLFMLYLKRERKRLCC